MARSFSVTFSWTGAEVDSSDSKGALPKDHPLHLQDALATMCRHLGIDTKINYIDYAGRPHPVLPLARRLKSYFKNILKQN